MLPPFDVAGSYGLFQQLFGPVRAEVLAARHLIYEPDGALIALPVATMVTDDDADGANRWALASSVASCVTRHELKRHRRPTTMTGWTVAMANGG